MSNRPPERPCRSCGYLCRSKDRICMTCSTGHAPRYDDVEPVGLEGGKWVPVRGVLRWQPDPGTEPEPTIDAHGLVACPTCRAHVDESCRTKSGRTTMPHSSRLAPRLCVCGERLERYRRLCSDCQRKRVLTSGRDYVQRRRAEAQYVEQVTEVAVKFAAITQRKAIERARKKDAA